MKISKLFFLFLLILLSMPVLVQAQDDNKTQAYWIHEDQVKPSMIKEYEQISKDLVAKCNEFNIQDTQWLTVALNDNKYLHVSAIENLAELDKNGFETLGEKMGKESMKKLFSRFNPCYDAHGDYVVHLLKDLSYMPSGLTLNPKDNYYRKFYYNYVTPENQKSFAENLQKIKDLFTKKNSKMEYRIYRSGFGVMGTYYLVVLSGKNGEDFEKMSSVNWENMKAEFEPLLDQMNKYTLKGEEKSGWMRPELSYLPQ